MSIFYKDKLFFFPPENVRGSHVTATAKLS